MKLGMGLVFVVLTASMIGCEPEVVKDADKEQSRRTAEMMAEANLQIGMPNIVNWQERKMMKTIMELRDREDLVCYAYIITITGEKVFLGRCLGYGLPYSVQFTNPERIETVMVYGNDQAVTIPQPDPNGLFMPEGLSATWLNMIDPETGETRPVYIENEIIVSPFKLH